jgi:hypothetical protein
MSWVAALPQLAALAGAVGTAYAVGGRAAAPWGALVYLAYSIGSRQLILRAHRAGIGLVKRQRFADAISKFQESLDFFDRHPWVDEFRSIVLMSPSAIGYREMALANIAFCYGQIGDGAQCRAYYQKCLERYPESGLATAALRMLDSASAPTPN